MPYYNLEPVLNFTHVLKAYTDVDHFVEVRLFKNNDPFDFSEAELITLTADKTVLPSDAIDMSLAADGVLRVNFKGLSTGAYLVPVVVAIGGETIVFGHIRVFVADTRRSDDITTFYYYPDTEEEEEEWKNRYGGDGADDDTIDSDEDGEDEDHELGDEEDDESGEGLVDEVEDEADGDGPDDEDENEGV